MCMWLRGAKVNNVFFFQSGWFVVVAQCIDIQLILLDVVTMLCIKFDLLLWESQYLASHLRESGAKNLTKWNRAEFHLFYKCLFECLKLFFFSNLYSRPSFNKFLNLIFSEVLQHVMVNIYYYFHISSFFLLFKSLLPFQLLLSFHRNFIALYSKFSLTVLNSFILQVFFLMFNFNFFFSDLYRQPLKSKLQAVSVLNYFSTSWLSL